MEPAIDLIENKLYALRKEQRENDDLDFTYEIYCLRTSLSILYKHLEPQDD